MSASFSPSEAARAAQVRAAQVRLLYSNAYTGVAVTILAAPVLGYFQWAVVRHPAILGWLLYMLLVSVSRFTLARRYWRTSPTGSEVGRWSLAFAVGAGLAAAGWGAAGILLYPEGQLPQQVLLVFVLGGMMLGGAFLLAPRPEAFLAFLVPTGFLLTLRLVADGDQQHLAMGLLTVAFTIATLMTTWRFYRTMESALKLKFENEDLVRDLQIASHRTEALNEQLELRVQERTAELNESTVRLRAEIEHREQMEEELLRARKLESLGVLAGGIAHDFNNFLAVVQSSVELARMNLTAGTPVQDILEQIESACCRAASLSSELLTFARGGGPIRRVVPVARLVLEAVHLARAGTSISIAVDIADDLWSAEVDASQIGQVLHNILLNARQAMPEGGIIEVRARNIVLSGDTETGSGPHVRISIRDNGPGIPADVLPRIFDPYFTTKNAGRGLGLATAYAIVARHGGHISVESESGSGTLFHVDLPASQEHPAPEPAVDVRLRSGTGRLLVMDDEDALRTMLERLLNTLGYEVQGARDGAEAIALYEASRASGPRFDAILLDLTVNGGMGGVEAAARLKELDPSVRLIVSSGYSDAPVMSRFREYGFDDVIPKPWTMAQLSQVIQRVLVSSPERKPNQTL